jgi:signal transduction histidine kinase
LLIAAKQASEVKSRFVSMVSHELRTPLTSIKGALELLDGGLVGELPTQGKELIRIATKNSKRLATMINDLLDLDKLDDGGMQYENAPVEMAHLVRESIEANNSFGALNEVTFQAITPNDDVMIYGDHNRLMQVMANLLSNAAKFSSSGSNVEVTLTSTDTNAMISVQDHGIGISEKDQSRVFERFVQLESNDARRFGGSGLGLGIAKVIVEKHRGTIGFSSEEGKGTTFHFELPLLVGEDEK